MKIPEGFHYPSWFVKQQKSYDCMVACIAMFGRVSYETSEMLCTRAGWNPDHGIGVSYDITMEVLYNLGYKPFCFYKDFSERPSIVVLPSTSQIGLLHAVYFQDKTLYDPGLGIELYGRDLLGAWTSQFACLNYSDNYDLAREFIDQQNTSLYNVRFKSLKKARMKEKDGDE